MQPWSLGLRPAPPLARSAGEVAAGGVPRGLLPL